MIRATLVVPIRAGENGGRNARAPQYRALAGLARVTWNGAPVTFTVTCTQATAIIATPSSSSRARAARSSRRRGSKRFENPGRTAERPLQRRRSAAPSRRFRLRRGRGPTRQIDQIEALWRFPVGVGTRREQLGGARQRIAAQSAVRARKHVGCGHPAQSRAANRRSSRSAPSAPRQVRDRQREPRAHQQIPGGSHIDLRDESAPQAGRARPREAQLRRVESVPAPQNAARKSPSGRKARRISVKAPGRVIDAVEHAG